MATVDNSANKENDTQIANNKESTTTKTTQPITNGDKKEEEPTTNDNTNTKSDNETNPSKLLSSARQLMDSKNYSEASVLCSTALNIIQTQNKQQVTSIDSAQYYMAYGESLLRFIQSSNDLFAAPVRDSQKQHTAPEEEEEAPTLITDATDTTENKSNENSKEENDEEPPQEQAAEPATEPAAMGSGDIDTSEDREITWESFEYARVILEDYLNENSTAENKYIKMLGLTHSFLGELSIEDENNEGALKEFEKALELYVKCSDIIEYRQIAFDRFMACLAAQFIGNNTLALEHCTIALGQLSKRIIELLKTFKCDNIEEEYKENEYINLVNKAQGFIDGMNDVQKGSDTGKELVELNGSMNDLICKLDEVKENIKLEKENKGKDKGNSNNNNGNIMASDDPLAALINGLTSKFGIDQQQLDELDQLDMNKGNEKNTNKKEEGVTTIGFGTGGNSKENDSDDDGVNELGSFGGSKKSRKRKMDEAGIDMGGNEGKKIKLNSGAAVVPKVDESGEKKVEQ